MLKICWILVEDERSNYLIAKDQEILTEDKMKQFPFEIYWSLLYLADQCLQLKITFGTGVNTQQNLKDQLAALWIY